MRPRWRNLPAHAIEPNRIVRHTLADSLFLCIPSDHPRYTRGVPSPLVRRLGNPYLVITPLRAALYSHIGLPSSQPVLESFPVWDPQEQRAKFIEVVSGGNHLAAQVVHTTIKIKITIVLILKYSLPIKCIITRTCMDMLYDIFIQLTPITVGSQFVFLTSSF